MNREQTRRSILAAVLGGMMGVVGTPIKGYLDRFAPGSGSVWDTVNAELPDEVESPYGPASLSYDDGVAHVSADSEDALYFAAGYAQGADRLFQMNLIRRQMSG